MDALFTQKVAELVKDMLEKVVIRPSASAWKSPIVLVPKWDVVSDLCRLPEGEFQERRVPIASY